MKKEQNFYRISCSYYVEFQCNIFLVGEILLTVCYVLNRIPKSKSKTSPYEILKKRQPNLSYLRTWGCLAYVRIPDPKRVKLASRAYECVFIGYAINSKVYRFYDLNAKVIIESNDADFYENKFPFKLRNSGVLHPVIFMLLVVKILHNQNQIRKVAGACSCNKAQ